MNRRTVMLVVMGMMSLLVVTMARAATGPPPPAAGYFPTLQPVGSWSKLPSDATCASRVHQSSWEPRPINTKRNHVLINPAAWRAGIPAYDSSWHTWSSWLLPRVDGQYSGTTDEIFQWSACKWGIPDNVLRGIAVRESTWYQYLVYPGNRPVHDWGSGDVFTSASTASRVFCNRIGTIGHYDYQAVYGAGKCPKTFSITGLMSWEDPSWGKMAYNQNGTFPYSRNSTAFAEDYVGAYLRGCYEGWITWLGPKGDLWGCVGSWYSGDWHSADADGYISRVKAEIAKHTWLAASWPGNIQACSPTYGCPQADTLPDN